MKGVLTPEQQLKVLSRIWGADQQGYVFLPWIDGKCQTKEERRTRGSYHEAQAFYWPTDKPKILEHLSKHPGDDLYFTPCLFMDKRRYENMAEVETCLWADLDEVDPNEIDGEYRPTIAWETSPGRWQAIWILNKTRVGTSMAGKENHRLTMYLGADPSGWDTTQLLRVPGRKNHKPDYKAENNGRPVPGKLLWDGGPRYDIDHFDDLPEITTADLGSLDLMNEEVIAGVDRFEVWARVRTRVSKRVREYMGFKRSSQITEDMDRSDILWQIERDLADAGCNVAEIVAIIRPTVWNKFSGRGDELKRLLTEASKAVSQHRQFEQDGEEDGGALEDIGDHKPESIRWLSEVMRVPEPKPSWIVKNIWSKGACGFIAGDPKSYKSWMALDLAASISTGTPFLNDPHYPVVGGPQPVLYLQEEDSSIVVRDRVEKVIEGKAPHHHWNGYVEKGPDGAMYWHPPKADIPMGFFVRAGFTSSDPGWLMWLEDTIREGQFVMVIIDTMGTTAGEVDTDRASELNERILRPLKGVANRTGCAIAIVHHNKKSNEVSTRGGSKMLGSVALHAWVDDALYVHNRESLPGGVTRVRVDRESKASTEHQIVVEVPTMGIATDGTRTVWNPLTVDLRDAGDPDSPDDGGTPQRAPRERERSTAGKKISLAVTGRQVRTVEQVAEIWGKSRSATLRELKVAVKNGYVTGDEKSGFQRVY